jgi:hypothetical protein
MAVTRLSQSSLREGLEKYTTALGNYVPSLGVLDNLQTVTVGAGGAASIDFTSIPTGFQHLHVRYLARSDGAGGLGTLLIRFNSDTGNNYSQHYLYGTGATAAASASVSQPQTVGSLYAASTAGASMFGGGSVDILDYAVTSKNTVSRSFGGVDLNGSGEVSIVSGVWMNTSAVTSINIRTQGGNFVQHTTAALYGVVAR